MSRARIDSPVPAGDLVRQWDVTPMDAHAGAWAFASHHHSGQFSPLYQVLSACQFNPGSLAH